MALLPSHLIVEVNGIRPCMPDGTESKLCMLWNQEPIRIDLKYKCNGTYPLVAVLLLTYYR